ncbi:MULTISPECIES: response regulator transcription factor [Nocardia]|uniref:response regulator transcription factor n=1 Tax=Nocardia TaxID=1817 RepID=UPI001E2DB79B|nr:MULTISPECIES: response regulator transcription factor [Nocardia]
MNPAAHRCLIVDDSTAFCLAAREMLESAGMTVVGTASTLATAVESARATRPDLILADIDLGGESGFDVVEALHATDPLAMVILVSTHDEEDFAEMVESSSAIGFLPKFELSAELIVNMASRSSSRG